MKIVKVRVKDLEELKEIGVVRTHWALGECIEYEPSRVDDTDIKFTERMRLLCDKIFITAINNKNEFKFGPWTITEWMYDVIEEYDINSESKISDLESYLQYADEQLDKQSKYIEKLKGYIYELTVRMCDEMGSNY